MLEHFARVADAGALPLMVQDAPLSGVTLSVPFLMRPAREVPATGYFKIEAPGAAAKLRALIEAGGNAIAGPFDGVIRSDAVRHPLEPLHPATRAGLLELAQSVGPLALRWGR